MFKRFSGSFFSSARHTVRRPANDSRLTFHSLEDRRLLATFSVSNLNDAGAGSLRSAIDQANNSSGADEIAFVGAATSGVIALATGELEITEALTIDGPGQASLTIDAQSNSRIFNISATTGDFTLAGLTLTDGRTFGSNTNNNDETFNGGALISLTSGTLNIDHSTITGSSTIGDFARGGGIFSKGDVSFTRSTVSGNGTTGQQAYGGGVSTRGDLTLTGSTVSGNSTTGFFGFGGGLHATASGFLVLTQSTVSGNSTTGESAYAGGMYSAGPITITSSTVTDNHVHDLTSMGGGIMNNNDPISITNSIVAGNTAGGGVNDILPGTGSLSINYSLVGNGVTPDAGTSGNNVVTFSTPLLGPLANNGGPTQTHALLSISLAIDAGDPGIVFNSAEFDQRGMPFVRVDGSSIDIGAYERQPIAGLNLTVDTIVDEDDGDYSAGDLSLREAVLLANSSGGADTITFDPTTFATPQTIVLAGGELEITDTLTIDGSELANHVTIDANFQSRVLHFSVTTGDLSLSGLTLKNGDTTDSASLHGGGILFNSSGTLTLTSSTLSGNSTGDGGFDGNGEDGGAGGGIFTFSGAVVLTDSTLSGNSTGDGGFQRNGGDGGGIFLGHGIVVLTDSTISGNSTGDGGERGFFFAGGQGGRGGDGGGIYTISAGVNLTDSTLSGNSTGGGGDGRSGFNGTNGIGGRGGYGGNGGGIHTNSGAVSMTSSTLSGNSTGDGGTGGFGNRGGRGGAGGGISNYFGAVTLNSSTLSGNSTGGGGDSGYRPPFNIGATGGAGGAGGGIYTISGGVFLTDSTLSGNATGGGADGGTSDGNGRLAGNGGNGGGIHTRAGAVTLTSSTLSENSTGDGGNGGDGYMGLGGIAGSGGSGGAIYTLSGALALASSTLSGNSTGGGGVGGEGADIGGAGGNGGYGGGIRTDSGTVALTSSTLNGNSTGDGGRGGTSGNGEIGGNGGNGGGIHTDSGAVTLTGSTLSVNSTGGGGDGGYNGGSSSKSNGGSGGNGGAMYTLSGALALNSSTLSGNTTGDGGRGRSFSNNNSGIGGIGGYGGGIRTYSGAVTLISSTLSGNSTGGGGIGGTSSNFGIGGSGGSGGAIYALSGAVALANSTLSGNSAGDGGRGSGNGEIVGIGGIGGGIHTHSGAVALTRTTVAGNMAAGSGGGVFLDDSSSNPERTIENSIVAGNSDNGLAPDLRPDPGSTLTINHSLIGVADNLGTINGNVGNQTGTAATPLDPQLGPLADNGGPLLPDGSSMLTHTLLPGSPAIDTGDPAIVFNEFDFDQRGFGFVRIVGGRIDIGAYELGAVSQFDAPIVTSVVRDEGGVLARPDLLSTFVVSCDVDVSVSATDLSIFNDSLGGTTVDSASVVFSYSAGTQTATWDFSSLILDAAFYSFEFSDNITAVAGGLALDGDTDGNAGGDYVELVYIALPGDANLDGQVDVLSDAAILVDNLGMASVAAWAQGDFNGDGAVDVLNDAAALVNRLGQSVVPPSAALASVTVLASVATTGASEPAGFVTEQEDDRQRLSWLSPAQQLSLAGSQALDTAFASDSLIEEGVF